MNSGKIIGVGYTARVYEWEGNKVLKLFNPGYPYESAVSEYQNAMAIRDMNFSKPKAYEMISYNGQNGIIYDKVEGESLLDLVMKTEDLEECARCMARLHKSILQNEISNVPNYKDSLRYHISNTLLSLKEQKEIVQRIDNLSDGNTLCHGDFHVGNILMAGGQPYAIDFMNICHGNYLYDVARTVFLTEYTPVPPETKDREGMLYFKRMLSDLYLKQMDVTREMIEDYLSVIIAARKGECPDE